jgi:DNA-binding transcriptional LysR family regulator
MLVFAEIARSGGVRGAAANLGTPRSTVSRRLAQLESEIGAALVVRTSRRFALTALGASFAVECEALERALRSAEALVRTRASEPSGVLRVAVAPVLGEEILPRVIAELLARHPRLSVDARLGVQYVDLRRAAIDVALRAAELDDATDLFAVRLGVSVSGCYASPGYVAARGMPKTPSDLAEHDCVLVGARAKDTWTFRAGGEPLEHPVAGRARVDNFRVARDLAAAGAGIVRVASVFADPLVARGDLVPVLEPHWLSVPVYAVHAGPNPPTPNVRAFIDAARTAVADTLGAPSTPPRRPRPTRWRSA